jgi:hypothetical protein
MNLNEIADRLKSSEELQLQIIRDIGNATVALFAVFKDGNGSRLELAGTGSLVSVGASHYILTAAHVWHEALKSATKVGISITDDIDHHFLMDIKAIVPSGPAKGNDWDEWGPDLIFLRIPTEHLGTIKAYKSFYDPKVDGNRAVRTDCLEVDVLMGVPQALGKFRRAHADVLIAGYFTQGEVRYHARDGFDYFDCVIHSASPEMPKNFGGVSGGGFWTVRLYSSLTSGKIEWIRTLEGVAFYQLPNDKGRPCIRCHGPESVRAAMPAK